MGPSVMNFLYWPRKLIHLNLGLACLEGNPERKLESVGAEDKADEENKGDEEDEENVETEDGGNQTLEADASGELSESEPNETTVSKRSKPMKISSENYWHQSLSSEESWKYIAHRSRA
jgi:hypothetical protein